MRLNRTLQVAAAAGAVTLLAVACRQTPEETEAKPAAKAEKVAPTAAGAEEAREAAKPDVGEAVRAEEPAKGEAPAGAEGAKKRPARVAEAAGEAEEPQPFEGRKLGIVHTANVVGELEPCG
ncbi:MAG: hypothetical protein ACQEXJ_22185 [Myxococcota bacterium]